MYEEVLHYHPDQANRLPPLASTNPSRSSPCSTPGAHVNARRTPSDGEDEEKQGGVVTTKAKPKAVSAAAAAAAAAAAVAVAAAAAEASLGKKRARDARDNGGAAVVERGLDQTNSSAPYSHNAHAIPAGARAAGENNRQAQHRRKQQQQTQQQRQMMNAQKRHRRMDDWNDSQAHRQAAPTAGVQGQELARAPRPAPGSVREEEDGYGNDEGTAAKRSRGDDTYGPVGVTGAPLSSSAALNAASVATATAAVAAAAAAASVGGEEARMGKRSRVEGAAIQQQQQQQYW